MLLLPNAARTIFCTTNTSSFVQRDEEIPPIAWRPYRSRSCRNCCAANRWLRPMILRARAIDTLTHLRFRHAVRASRNPTRNGLSRTNDRDSLLRRRRGSIRINWSPFSSALSEQPTPQYAQVVFTTRSGWPARRRIFSINVAVGHACTHAPHDTHSESMNGSAALAAMRNRNHDRPLSARTFPAFLRTRARSVSRRCTSTDRS